VAYGLYLARASATNCLPSAGDDGLLGRMDKKTKMWLIALGVVTYGLWTANLFVASGPLRTVLSTTCIVLVALMGIVFVVGISAFTQKQWDRLRAEGSQVTAVIKGYHKARVMFEIQLPGGSITGYADGTPLPRFRDKFEPS
jgi:hypothetical protein